MDTLELLTSRLRTNPADHEAYQGLKSYYSSRGDLGALASLINNWAKAQGGGRPSSTAYVEAGDVLVRAGDPRGQAEALYREALRCDEHNLAAVEALLTLYRQQGRDEEAAEFLRGVLRRLPQLGATPKQLAFLRYRLAELCDKRLHHYPEALQNYTLAFEQDPTLLRAMYDARQLQLASNNIRAAAELYEREIAAEPNNERKIGLLRELAALQHVRLGHLDDAIESLSRAYALSPADPEIGYELARLLMQRADRHPTPNEGMRIAELLSSIATGLPRDRAIPYLESGLRYAPAHEHALEQLERLIGDTDPLRIAPYWVAYLAAAPYGRLAHPRRVKLAHAYAQQGQLEDAIFCLGPAADAEYVPAVELLAELHGRSPLTLSPLDALEPEEPAAHNGVERPRASAPPIEAPPKAQRESAAPRAVASKPPPAPIDAREADIGALRRKATELIARYRQDEAAAVYEQLLQLNPLDREAFAFLDGFLRRKQQHERRTALLEHTASVPGLPVAVRVTRLREAAGTYEARLKDFEAALRCLNTLAELEPENEEVSRDRRRLLERAGHWDELAGLLERELSRAGDVEMRATLLRRIATLQRDSRGDRVASADALERLLRLRPDDRIARDQLIEDRVALGRYDLVVELLEHKVEEAMLRSQRLPALRQLAAMYRDQLADPVRTRDTYERILELAPKDIETLEELARIDREARDFPRLLATLDRLVAAAPGPNAAALIAQMAHIAEYELEDVDRAIGLLGRAPQLAPQHPEYGEAFASLLHRHKRYAQLVTWLRTQVSAERNVAARIELYRRIARLLQSELSDGQGAAEAWKELLAIREDREALLALQERALELDQPEELVALLARLAALESDPLEKRDLLFERATVLARRLEQPAQALPDLTRILLDLDLEFEPALEELRRVAKTAREYQGLAQVLEQRLQRPLRPAIRIEHARELSLLYQSELVDTDRAIGSLQRWAAADPNNPEPRRQLKPLLTRSRRYAELLGTLDELALVEESLDDRRRASLDAAELAQTELADADGAWQRLLPLVEQGLPAAVNAMVTLATKTERQGALYGLLERTGQYDVLLSLLEGRLQSEENPGVRADFLKRIAHVLIEHKHDEEGAARAYRTLLELKEDPEALRFLLLQATRADDAPELAKILRRLAELETDAQERRGLLLRYTQLLSSRLGRAAEAVPILLELVQQQPDDAELVDELVRACENAHEHATLASVLERMLARERDPNAYVAIAKRLADVCEIELQDSGRSVSALNKWAAAAPTDPEPHRRLRPHLQAFGHHRELLATLDALARLAADAPARLEATLAAAELARTKLGEPQVAWDRLAPLLGLGQPRVDRALHLLAIETQRLDELYALLEQNKRQDTLVEWLKQRVQHEPNRAVVVALYRRMARNLAGPLDDETAAEAAWLKLLEIIEDAEALNYLRAQALRRDDVALLSDCLRRLAALELDPTEKRDLLYEHGHVLRARLDRPLDAIGVLRSVVEELDPNFEPALDELVEACRAAGDEQTLVWAYERVLERENDLERRADLARQLSELYRDRLHDRERAMGALRAWAEAAPADPEPHRRQVELLEGTTRHVELLAALDALAKLGDAPQRARAIESAAELALQTGDANGAFNRLLSLVNSGNVGAEQLLWRIAFEQERGEELVALYDAVGRQDDLVSVLKSEAERTPDSGRRAELFRRCARLLVTPLADEEGAAEAYREVLKFAEDEEALTFLYKRASERDDATELAELLPRLVPLVNEPERKRALLFQRAELLATRLDHPETAIDVLRGLLLHVDAGFAPAIDLLTSLCTTSGNADGLALALESRLALAQTAAARAELAKQLADLYESTLLDEPKAIAALQTWCEATPDDPVPYRRLRPILERRDAWDALLVTLDTLGRLEPAVADRNAALLAAASVCAERRDDAEGAWQRISPLMLGGDDAAEQAARALAERAQNYRPLANLYVLRARKVASPRAPKQDWLEAARVYDEQLEEPREAFEATVRAFAIDTRDYDVLREIDRLAAAAGLWERLRHVYNKLVQQAPDDATKLELLTRHAAVLESHGAPPAPVLERLMQASRLAPHRVDLLRHAEALALQTGAHAELVFVYERLAQQTQSEDERLGLLLQAAKAADLGLGDREQAFRDLRAALLLSEHIAGAASRIELTVRELDEARPDLGATDARQTLVQMQLALAEQCAPAFGAALIRHAARLLEDELADAPGCFDALKHGAALFPSDLELYDALEQAALRTKRLDALDAHLSRSIQRSSDSATKRALLLRRGHVLSEHLQRHAKAADVYRELMKLDAHDETVLEALSQSLRRAGRFQEFIKVSEERIAHRADVGARAELLREMARVWETDLKNRPAAADAWRRLKLLAPDDAEAAAALERLLH